MNKFKNNLGQFFSLFASKNSNFRVRIYKEFWGIIFGNNFGELISGLFLGTTLGTSFGVVESGELLWGSFGNQLWKADFGKNFGK
jgi:hypothetical protein